MIAMALSCNPKLLIADEPTTALDVTIQAQILELLNELKTKLNMAVMLITHDMGVIAETAQRVVVMYAAKVAEEAPVGDLFKEPLHPYTQGLLRSIPRIDLAATRTPRLETIPGTVPTLRGRHRARLPVRAALPVREVRCTEKDPVLKEVKPGHKVVLLALLRGHAMADTRSSESRTSRSTSRSAAGSSRARSRACTPSTTCRFDIMPGRDARPGGRVGLRQVDDRAAASCA